MGKDEPHLVFLTSGDEVWGCASDSPRMLLLDSAALTLPRELSGARPRPTPWRATRTEASPDFGSKQLTLTLLETDTIYLISNPLARPLLTNTLAYLSTAN